MKPSESRILDAAEILILRDGVARLTIEAVAAEAGLSKGGVLYHFPTKDALIRGMIERLQEEFEAEMQRVQARDAADKGRYTRAYLATTFPEKPSETSARLNQAACSRC